MKAAVVLGLVNGLAYALLAVGLVLVYKAGRFVNFAHAQLGVLPAILLGKVVLDWGWSYWIAFPLAIAMGAGIGALVERTVIRKLAGGSRTALLVATVGVSQVLLAPTYLRSLGPNTFKLTEEGYPLPFDVQFRVDALVLRGQHVLILVIGPLLILGLAALLRATWIGKAIRAAATNADAAALAGVPLASVYRATWVMAGGLSAATAVLLAPGQTNYDTQGLGPFLLLRALGAAAVGGLRSFPWAVGAGIGLGVVEAVALRETRQSGIAEVVLLVVILVALFVRGRQAVAYRQRDDDLPQLDDRPAVVPEAVRDRFYVRRARLLLGSFGLLAGLLAPHLPPFRDEGDTFLLALVVVFALVGIAMTMLVGWAGQISLGHFALLGVGAYVAVRMSASGWSMPIVLLVGGAVAALVAVLVGLPATRFRGPLLAVSSLGLAVVAPTWLFVQPWFGHEGSRSVEPMGLAGVGRLGSQRSVYYTALLVLAVVLLGARALRSSRTGRLLVAVRDNPDATASFGVPPAAVKLVAFALSGFCAGMAGVLWAAAFGNVSAELFRPEQSLLMLAIPVVGGLGSLPGAVLGSVVLFGLPTFFGDWIESTLGLRGVAAALLVSGLGLLATQLHFPGGIASGFRALWERFLAMVASSVERDRAEVRSRARAGVVLETRGLRVQYGGVTALDGVSMEVREGEIVGLIGGNGAGKTTLVDVVSGTVCPDAGSILVDGHDLRARPVEFRSHVGIARTFQDPRLFAGLTVREVLQIAQSGRVRVGTVANALGLPWARFAERATARRADELIERFGLGPWADVPAAGLSTGTRRIVELAAQVATQPKLLLLDEPTAGVAQREAEAFVPVLRRLRDELGCSILLIEHDMPLLLGLADRVYCMEAGRVIAEGTAHEIRTDERVIASYLGTDHAAIERSGGRTHSTRSRRRRVVRSAVAAAVTREV